MAQDESYDMLGLANNLACRKMLDKINNNEYTNGQSEKVILSANVVKINKRGKHQNRVLLITNKALYNLKDKDYDKLKRRIELIKIDSMTISTLSDEFALHIPDEYDYRYESNNKELIYKVLNELFIKKNGKKIALHKSNNKLLNNIIITKDIAKKIQTREERLQKYKELLAKEDFEDESKDARNSKIVITLKNDSNKKIGPNDFHFLKVIGRGSFGKVMQVQKIDTGEIFAMKILKKKQLILQNQVEHTNAERRILEQMDHPFLMNLRYAFQTESKLYFVLDYYCGGELFFHLKKILKFSEKEARIIVLEVALALGHLHSMNIIYRDLKPENILLDNNGHVCLTDFGLSKEFETNEISQTFAGTPEYLSPEMITNEGHTTNIDWWALGILLYELVIGIPPFYSQNIHKMYSNITNSQLLFPQKEKYALSNEYKDLISKLLVKDPRQRLGCLNDVYDIIKHPFFAEIDIQKLLKKEIEPIYKPKVKAKNDLSNVDKVFLNEEVVDSRVSIPKLQSYAKNDGFVDFTFDPNNGEILN